jgi:hypothetical protein
MEKVFIVLGWFVMATLALAIARQLSEQIDLGNYASASSPWQTEGFVGAVSKNDTLLSDVFQPAAKAGNLSAKTCYAADFASHTQKTGNYLQRTNNFKHGIPDSCSSPFTELVNSFYSN